MSADSQNVSSLPVPVADGVLGRLAVGALLVLAACMLVTFVFATLMVTGTAQTDTSAAAEQIDRLFPYIMVAGALSGVLAGVCSFALAVRQRGRGQAGWTVMLVAAGVSAIAAASTMILGTITAAGVMQLPVAGETGMNRLGEGSAIALLIACAFWAMRCWQGQRTRVVRGDFNDAEAKIAACLKQVTGGKLLGHLRGVLLSAGLVGLAISVPVDFFAIGRADAGAGGLAGAMVLSASGVVLFCLLQCVLLTAAMSLLIGMFRIGLIGDQASAMVGLASGVFAFLFSQCGLNLSFGDQIRVLGLTVLVMTVLMVYGLFFGVAVSRYVLELCRESRRPRDFADLIRISIIAGATFPLLAVLQWARRRVRANLAVIAVGCAVLAIIIALMIKGMFPSVYDFMDKIQFFLVIMTVLMAVLVGHVVNPAEKRWPKARLVALVLLTTGCLAVVVNSDKAMASVRPKVFQYTPLGKYSLNVIEWLVAPNEPMTHIDTGWKPPLLKGLSIGPKREIISVLKKKKPLTILIIWDAARPDRMSLHGYRRSRPPLLATTPNLDKYKSEFLRFTNAFSQATATSCSMRHLFTGRYSSRWMLKTEGISPFWTNELIRAGYHSFFMNIIGSDYNGLSLEAFYRDMPESARSRLELLDCTLCPKENLKKGQKHGRKATPELLRKLAGKPKFIECNRQNEQKSVHDLLAFLETQTDTHGSGVFAYIHMDATHTPWSRFAEVEDFGDSKQNRYDQTMRYSDMIVGELIEGLKKLSMWDDTILIVTADHGTGLNDHEKYGGFHPWFEQIHIPLVVKIPGVPGREIDTMVGLFDLGPTLMDVFFPDTLDRYEGRSLWPVILDEQKWPKRVMFGLNAFANCYYLIAADGFHYIRQRTDRYEQLYNWRLDRAETSDLMGVDFDAVRLNRTRMNWFLNVHGKGRGYTNPYHWCKPPE